MQVDQQPQGAPSRQQLQGAIAQLEKALAALEGQDEVVRAPIQAQLAEKKKQLGELLPPKPVGKRLDGARAALERAAKRQQAADEGVELALAVQKAAAEETAKLRAEVV